MRRHQNARNNRLKDLGKLEKRTKKDVFLTKKGDINKHRQCVVSEAVSVNVQPLFLL